MTNDVINTLETACFHHNTSINRLDQKIANKLPEPMEAGLHLVPSMKSQGLDLIG